MVQIIHKITLEVSKPNFLQAIVAKQFDNKSRFINATLVQDKEKINVPNTSTVTINAKRNDGAENSFVGEVNEDSTVTVPLTYWMLELSGTLECDISIVDTEGRKLTTTKFTVEVEKASYTGEDEGSVDEAEVVIIQGHKGIVTSVNGQTGDVVISADTEGQVEELAEEFRNHNHDDSYAEKKHKHDDNYAAIDHNHDETYCKQSDLDSLQTEVDTFDAAIEYVTGAIALIRDYVVAEGVDDSTGWHYRAWSSGCFEIWGQLELTVSKVENLDNNAVSTLKQVTAEVKLPDEMIVGSVEYCSLCPKDWFVISAMASISNNNLWGRFTLDATRANGMTVGTSTLNVNAHVKGRYDVNSAAE